MLLSLSHRILCREMRQLFRVQRPVRRAGLAGRHDAAKAILALATRRDERALEPLQRELRSWPEWDHCLEAAKHFRSSELLPLLEALLQQHPERELELRQALEACRCVE